MKPTISLFIVLMALTGCTLAWGASFDMVSSSPDMVQYEYELATVNRARMDAAAQDHCWQYRKDAVLDRVGYNGRYKMNTYVCVAHMGAYGDTQRF